MILEQFRILLIEDDIRLAAFISSFLSTNGFHVTHCASTHELDLKMQSQETDLIICDIMLPGTDGYEIINEIRDRFAGIFVFMSALSDVENQLKGFELGADDYIVKPIKPELLLARINAALKRGNHRKQKHKVKVGNLTIDKSAREVTVNESKLTLSRHEFDVLWLLALNKNKPLTREYLFINTIGREYDGQDRTIDGRISRLRKKVEQADQSHCKVKTMWGQGYMLTVENLM